MPDKPLAIICDLDGTLAIFNGRGPFEMEMCESDTLCESVARVLDLLAIDGYKVLLVTGRFERVRPQTEAWLERYHILYDALWMRADGDMRKDAEVKRELYESEIAPHYRVFLSLDDRNQSVEFWRSLDIPCWQVAPGDF